MFITLFSELSILFLFSFLNLFIQRQRKSARGNLSEALRGLPYLSCAAVKSARNVGKYCQIYPGESNDVVPGQKRSRLANWPSGVIALLGVAASIGCCCCCR